MPILEKEIENDILEYLNYLPRCKAYKVKTMGTFNKNGGHYNNSSKYYLKGVSDIIGIYKGKKLCIEVKVPTRRKNVSKNQKEFLEMMRDLGAIAFVACSVDDVIKGLSDYEQSILHNSHHNQRQSD